MKKHVCLMTLVAVFASLLSVSTLSGSERQVPEKVVPSRSFLVTVKPAGKESADAQSAELFISRFPGSGWVLEGECNVKREKGELLFARAVRVPSDGVYYFTSRGADEVGKAAPPLKGDKPQVKVIADTTAPVIRITSPKAGSIFRAGETLSIQWQASDKNLALHPISLAYSTDNGQNWRVLRKGLPNTGHYQWKIPQRSTGQLRLRATCIDRAGNSGFTEPEFSWKVMPKQHKANYIAADIPAEPKVPVMVKETVAEEVMPGKKDEVKVTATETIEAPVKESEVVLKNAPHLLDPRPQTKYPQLDANSAKLPMLDEQEGKTAYIAYVMAGNLVRQGRLKDSLRYYRTAVDIDGRFAQAWNDMALVYKELGAYTKADACIVKALKVDPKSPRYLNTRGGIYQAAGFEILRDPASGEESLARASDLILFAVKTFGKAVEVAQHQGRLAECAETYFHLGEICYFANQDPQGARQYWVKVLDLHSPTPDLDPVVFDKGTPAEKLTRSIYEKNTEMWVTLQTWQSWARDYLKQLNKLEQGAAMPSAPFTLGQFKQYSDISFGAGNRVQQASPSAKVLVPVATSQNRIYYRQVQPGQPQQQNGSRVIPQVDTSAGNGNLSSGNAYYYQPQGPEAQQSRVQTRVIKPQASWLKNGYGSKPGYTFRHN